MCAGGRSIGMVACHGPSHRFQVGRPLQLAGDDIGGPAARREILVGRPRAPLSDRLERGVQETLTAGMALDLAARCFGNAAGLDQRDRFDGQIVLGRDVPANGLEHARQLALLPALDLLHHDKPLGSVDLNRHRGAIARSQPRMALTNRQLNVLRIMVQPANDDQVFQPAGDEHFAVLHEAQITGPQERTLARVLQIGPKGLLGGFLARELAGLATFA